MVRAYIRRIAEIVKIFAINFGLNVLERWVFEIMHCHIILFIPQTKWRFQGDDLESLNFMGAG